jgi:hypothetical protein
MSQENVDDLFSMVVGSPCPEIDKRASSLEVLHQDFHSLVMLLNLVASLNNGGHPTLGSFLERHGALEQPQSFPSILLNAFACVLVQNNEVIAVIGSSPLDLGILSTDISDPTDVDDMDAKTIEATFPLMATHNPDRNEKVCPRPPSDADCATFEPERSHWNDIMEDGWWALDHLSG